MHALQDLAYVAVEPALAEIHRVLRPGGILRQGLPDLERAVLAYRRGDRDCFYVPDDDAKTIGGKLCVQVSWYGSVGTPFTYDFAEEMLLRAGFSAVWRASYRHTDGPFPDIVLFDNRDRQTLFVEATR